MLFTRAAFLLLVANSGLHFNVNGLLQAPFGGPKVQVSGTNVVATSSVLQMQVPILDDWQLLKSGEVCGTVRNHPVLDDGDTVKTSALVYPAAASPRKVVMTASGSKYRLGTPSAAQQSFVAKPAPAVNAAGTPSSDGGASEAKALKEALRKATAEYNLNGKSIGDGEYLLAGKPEKTTSGKSFIYTCYKNGGNGLPVGEALCAKVSTNFEAIQREYENYQRITRGLTRGQFVKFFQFYESASKVKPLSNSCAIIIERGALDLKTFIEKNGPLSGKELRAFAVAAIQCLQACHSANLVWTDLKAENFVVTDVSKTIIKGIDLESAMPFRDNPVDYSPEACPPEFAEAFLSGDGPYFVLDSSYDIWSLGMLLYEVSAGSMMMKGKSAEQITKILRDPSFTPDTSAVPDEKLRSLIDSCLQVNPKKRPSLTQILLHPFFVTTGFGPFSF